MLAQQSKVPWVHSLLLILDFLAALNSENKNTFNSLFYSKYNSGKMIILICLFSFQSNIIVFFFKSLCRYHFSINSLYPNFPMKFSICVLSLWKFILIPFHRTKKAKILSYKKEHNSTFEIITKISDCANFENIATYTEI